VLAINSPSAENGVRSVLVEILRASHPIVLVILLVSAEARAQDYDPAGEPPPTVAPIPGHMAAPPPPATRYSRYQARWYLGLGLGGGASFISDNNTSFRDNGTGGLSLLVRGGWVAVPWLLVGFEGSGWINPKGGRSVALIHADAMLTAFPFFDLGLFIKLGLGAGFIMVNGEPTGLGLGDKTDAGFDVKAGLGYELQLSRSLALGFDATYALTRYSGGRTDEVCGFVTLSWY
jgi:hypothetical protein